MSVTVKDFLGSENARNKANAELYTDLLKLAYPDQDIAVLIGHHICFEFDKDLSTENEIPAADTLIFDHEIALRVFGPGFKATLAFLAVLESHDRDAALRREVERIKARKADARRAPNFEVLQSLDV